MRIERFEQMEIWKLARALNRDIYSVSGKSAFARDLGMGNQIRRASVSIASNIAEGFESQSNASFIRYLVCARGSAAEVRAQLYLAMDLGYLSEGECGVLRDRTEAISREITGFIKYLRSTNRKG